MSHAAAIKAALDLHQATEAYTRAWNRYMPSIPRMLQPKQDPQDKHVATPRFWELLGHYRQEVLYFVFRRGDKHGGVDSAAWEFFRKTFHGECDYTVDEALSFAMTYDRVSGSLYRPLFDVVTDRGDDAYGDLLDSLPLAGEPVVSGCIAGAYKTNGQVEDAVLDALGTILPLATKGVEPTAVRDFILNGENYNRMKLCEAAQKRFLMMAVDRAREDAAGRGAPVNG